MAVKEKQTALRTIPVQIRKKDGRLKYHEVGNPNCNSYRVLVHRRQPDRVKWKCQSPGWEVLFNKSSNGCNAGTPFEGGKTKFSEADPEGTIDRNAALGIYCYTVKAFDIVDDPEVDVED